jgi:hypothetical protein
MVVILFGRQQILLVLEMQPMQIIQIYGKLIVL